MRISRIILRVDDVSRSVEFWSEAVGLQMIRESANFAFLDGGSVELVLNEVESRPDDSSLTEIVIEVSDVRESYRVLADRGVEFAVEPRAVMTDGERELWATHFRDPDGHVGSIVGWVV